MKHLFSIILLLSFSIPSFSYQLRTQIATSAANELEKRLIMTCQAEETICKETCGLDKGCILPETICQDCATRQSQLFTTMVTDIKSIFKTDPMFVAPSQVAKFFKKKKFMVITYDTFLNFLTPEKKSVIKTDFESLCYVDVDSAMMLIAINDQTLQMEELVGTICHDKEGYSSVLPMELNSNFSNKTLDFWKSLENNKKVEMGLK